MAKSTAQRVRDAIESIPFEERKSAQTYTQMKAIEKRLETILGLRVLVQSDASSTPLTSRLNVTVWHKQPRNGRRASEVRNAECRYFYA